MPAVRPMLRAVGHGVPTAHGPKWADSCGSRWEQRVLLRPPVDEQLGRNALREVRESDHPMTAPDPLALAAALRAAHEENRRIREALKGLRAEMPNRCTCAEDYTERDMIDPACNYHDYGGWALRVIDAALAGGKGEG